MWPGLGESPRMYIGSLPTHHHPIQPSKSYARIHQTVGRWRLRVPRRDMKDSDLEPECSLSFQMSFVGPPFKSCCLPTSQHVGQPALEQVRSRSLTTSSGNPPPPTGLDAGTAPSPAWGAELMRELWDRCEQGNKKTIPCSSRLRYRTARSKRSRRWIALCHQSPLVATAINIDDPVLEYRVPDEH
ncbi:hypothetical protein B0H11DRAFT_1307794 [Mycena galericulata]|nr:hypothetical protein B0H11DRAFT_1307794 [Mycena galericulata]